jgi:hypothetical protein
MMYEVRLVNPKTNEERKIVVDADEALANASPSLQTYVQDVARPEMPAGFMPLGKGVRQVLLS